MTVSIEIPTFEFSGHYYGEILEDLIQYLRDEGMDIDESPEEPFIQLLRSFALSAHLNNVLADHVANELYLPTAKLRDSVRALLYLIDYRMAQPSPATVDVILRLSRYFDTDQVPWFSKTAVFATRASRTNIPIEFEPVQDYDVDRSDQVSQAFSSDFTPGVGGINSDITSDVNDTVNPFSIWSGAYPTHSILISHEQLMFDKIRVEVTSAGGPDAGRWEYSSGDESHLETPDAVAVSGPNLLIDLDLILGGHDARFDGARCVVRCLTTGVEEECEIDASGSTNRITTSSFLGQSPVSTDPRDYGVWWKWRPFTLGHVTDPSDSFRNTGVHDIVFTMPGASDPQWYKRQAEVYGVSGSTETGLEAQWIRWQSAGTYTTVPVSLKWVRIHEGEQYLRAELVQGRTRSDNPLGSSTGLPSQSFTLARFPVIDDANLRVWIIEGAVESEWARVEDDKLTNANPTDKVFAVEFDGDLRGVVKFGDGVYGKIPAAGVDNIRSEYRTLPAEEDGNVPANTVIVNRGGIANVRSLTNPEAASGYQVAEGSTEPDLERVKLAGPESLRVSERMVGPRDVDFVALNWTDPVTGTRPFVRARSFETAGTNTVDVVVIGPGGAIPSASQMSRFEDYLNGTPTEPGVLIFNYRANVTAPQIYFYGITATIYGAGTDPAPFIAELSARLGILAKELNPDGSEGTEWEWDFGESHPTSRIINIIMETEPNPRKVTLTLPASDVIPPTARYFVAPDYSAISITMAP